MFNFFEKYDSYCNADLSFDFIKDIDFYSLDLTSQVFQDDYLGPFEKVEDIIEGKIKEEFCNNGNIRNIKKKKKFFNFEKTGYTSSKKNSNNNIQINEYILEKHEKSSNQNDYTEKPQSGTKLLGRKKKSSNELGEHNKFSDDNLSRKCKHVIIDNLISLINNLIKKYYDDNDDKNQLLKINQRQIIISKVDYNKNFLKKQLKDILSDKISSKYKKYISEHNKNLIQRLLNEKDEEKRTLFIKIFNLTFLDCLNHFIGKVKIKELEGLIGVDEVIEQIKEEKDNEDYKIQFKNFIFNYERILNEKKVRNRGKKRVK